MKKIATIIAFMCALSLDSNAQAIGSSAKEGSSNDKCIKKGSILIDAYYGFPNWYASIFKALVANSHSTDISVKSIGPIGGKAEYLLTEKFGMGLDFNYSNVKVTFSDNVTNSSGNPTVYHYVYASPAFRAMLGFNFHFVNTDKIDVYAAVKTGYYSRTYSFTSDQPGYPGLSIRNYVPVAFRLETGMRFFLTDFIGLHVNLGLGGGPLIAGGISAKF